MGELAWTKEDIVRLLRVCKTKQDGGCASNCLLALGRAQRQSGKLAAALHGLHLRKRFLLVHQTVYKW